MSNLIGGQPDHRLERMILFSDAVFAIAITLLVIEIDVPRLSADGPAAAYWQALAEHIPSFFGFVLSFLVIGRFWSGHHAMFSQVARFDESLVWPNLQLLMMIAFMPFATAFLTRNIGAAVPSLIYNLCFLATALLSVRLAHKALSPELLGDGADLGLVRLIKVRGWAVVVIAMISVIGVFFVSLYSTMFLATTSLWLQLITRWNAKKAVAAIAAD